MATTRTPAALVDPVERRLDEQHAAVGVEGEQLADEELVAAPHLVPRLERADHEALAACRGGRAVEVDRRGVVPQHARRCAGAPAGARRRGRRGRGRHAPPEPDQLRQPVRRPARPAPSCLRTKCSPPRMKCSEHEVLGPVAARAADVDGDGVVDDPDATRRRRRGDGRGRSPRRRARSARRSRRRASKASRRTRKQAPMTKPTSPVRPRRGRGRAPRPTRRAPTGRATTPAARVPSGRRSVGEAATRLGSAAIAAAQRGEVGRA